MVAIQWHVHSLTLDPYRRHDPLCNRLYRLGYRLLGSIDESAHWAWCIGQYQAGRHLSEGMA